MHGARSGAESMAWKEGGPAGITFQRMVGSGPAMLRALGESQPRAPHRSVASAAGGKALNVAMKKRWAAKKAAV
jgi:hypothetical protein